MKKGKGSIRKYVAFVMIALVLAVGVLLAFNRQAVKTKVKEKEAGSVSELTILLNKDLENDYPDTPRAVVDMYSRIITQYYEGISEKDLLVLIDKVRILMDEELLGHNPYDEFVSSVKEDVKAYEKAGQRITYYVLENSYDVDYKKFQGKEYGRLGAMYNVRGKSGITRTMQYYTLRKDDAGRWKILYWELGENNEDGEKQE